MSKVYVITRGDYSDYCIDRVFATREAAEKYCATWKREYSWSDEPRIEEYDLEDGSNIQVDRVYKAISFNERYQLFTDTFYVHFDMLYGVKPFEEKINRNGKLTTRDGRTIETYYGTIQVNKTILEEKEAEKIVHDHIAKWKAEQMGL